MPWIRKSFFLQKTPPFYKVFLFWTQEISSIELLFKVSFQLPPSWERDCSS